MEESIGFGTRLKHAWNAFMNKDPTKVIYREIGSGYSYKPDRVRFSRGAEKSIVTSVYNRIAMDVAAIDVRHVLLDENGRFLEEKDSALNNCFSLEANLDQTSRAFMQDVVMSMMDEGCVAIVPTDTTSDPDSGMDGAFDINEMRTGRIVQWYPAYVKVEVYNEHTGQKQEIICSKRSVAIIENPLYAIMNEPNSTMQRLIRKLGLLDVVDERNSSGKLDLIIQLPYMVKSDARKQQAEERRKMIEDQLVGSKYGVAYIDATEHITQLNRPLENNLMAQVQYLQETLYAQLGITKEILNGTADDKAMLNYNNRTVEPIIAAIVDEMKRKFLSKTARSQRQSIMYFRNPFRLIPVDQIAEMADKMTRNEIMTSNEFRQIVGLKPSDDPDADVLRNKNLNQSNADLQQQNPNQQFDPNNIDQNQYYDENAQ